MRILSRPSRLAFPAYRLALRVSRLALLISHLALRTSNFALRAASRLAASRPRGFTLIELLVVMAIIATLLTLAVPYYFGSLQKSREAVLRENLVLMRDALDKHYGDAGRYPDRLDDLVEKRYLRRIPTDPITESTTTWVTVPPQDPAAQGAVYDVKSGAEGSASDGSAYTEW